MPEPVIDQVARDKANDATHAIANFRQVTEVRLTNIDAKIDTTHAETNSKIDEMKSAMKWAGGLIVSLILTVLGWAVVQQLNTNEAQKKDMQQQIQLLQQDQRARVEARQEILSRLPPRAPETTDATVRAGER